MPCRRRTNSIRAQTGRNGHERALVACSRRLRRPTLEPVLAHDSMELRLAPKMQQQPNLDVGRAEITKQLRCRLGAEPLRRLVLDDDLLVDDHIDRLWGHFEEGPSGIPGH